MGEWKYARISFPAIAKMLRMVRFLSRSGGSWIGTPDGWTPGASVRGLLRLRHGFLTDVPRGELQEDILQTQAAAGQLIKIPAGFDYGARQFRPYVLLFFRMHFQLHPSA